MSLLAQLKGQASQPAPTLTKEDEMVRLQVEEVNSKYPGAISAVLKLEALNLGMPKLTGEAAKVYFLAKKQPIQPELAGSGEIAGAEFADPSLFAAVLAEAEAMVVKATPPAEGAAGIDPFPADAPAALASVPEPVVAAAPVVTDAASAMQAAAAASEPKKRGPKKKVKEEALEETVQIASTEEAAGFDLQAGSLGTQEIPATPAKLASDERLVAKSAGGLNLFVDCIPSVDSVSLWPTINKITDAIAAKCGAVDYRCCEKGTPGEYGQWKGLIAAGLRALRKAGALPDGNYTLDNTMSETGGVVIEAMRALVAESGGMMVKGVR